MNEPTPTAPEKRTYPVCAKCNSDNVLFDAYAEWNVDTQQFEVQNTFDKGSVCESCGGECSIEWETLDSPTVAEANAARCVHQDLEERAEQHREQVNQTIISNTSAPQAAAVGSTTSSMPIDPWQWIEQIARLTTASEMDEAEDANDGEAMSGDDACSAISNLIEEAREMLKNRPVTQVCETYTCNNCELEMIEEQLKPIKDIFQRVAPGEPMPAGECPVCHALVHTTGDKS